MGLFDWGVLDSRLYNQVAYQKECAYVVPKNWSVQTNGSSYIVAHKDDNGTRYLTFYMGTELQYSNVQAPSVFMDSCKAKRCLRLYLEQQNSILKGYK